MTLAEALRLIQGYAAAGRVRFTTHAEQRMEQRHVTRREVSRAIATATDVSPSGEAEAWRLDGRDTDGDALTVVCALRDGVIVVTVF